MWVTSLSYTKEKKRWIFCRVLSTKGFQLLYFPHFCNAVATCPQPEAFCTLLETKVGQHNLGENTNLGQAGREGWGLIPLLATAHNFCTECSAQRHFELGLVTGPRSLLTQAASVSEPQTYCVCSAPGPAGLLAEWQRCNWSGQCPLCCVPRAL